jgi:hypothetical protein
MRWHFDIAELCVLENALHLFTSFALLLSVSANFLKSSVNLAICFLLSGHRINSLLSVEFIGVTEGQRNIERMEAPQQSNQSVTD